MKRAFQSFCVFVQIFVFLGSLAAQETTVTWAGEYNGKHWPAKTYSRSNLCCDKQNCGMRQAILDAIAAKEARQTSTVSSGTAWAPNQTSPVSYRREVRTKTVKRCNGRRCWYEDVQEVVWVPIYPAATSTNQSRDSPTKSKGDLAAEDITLRLEPTPQPIVDALLSVLQPQFGELLVDLGCGDGRFPIAAAKKFGCRGRGIELNTKTATQAREAVLAAGVDVEIIEGDILKEDFSDANIVVMYLYQDLIKEVWPRIEPGTLVASVNHELPGSCRKITHGDWSFWITIKRKE